MGSPVGGESEFAAEINITPMVDIMLVLLIIFMVVTPLLQQGVSVNLPREVEHADIDLAINKESAVVLAIPQDNQYFVGKEPFPKDALGERIGKLMERKTAEEKIVYIKSGTGVSYGNLVEAINILRSKGIDKIGLIADRKKGGAAPAK